MKQMERIQERAFRFLIVDYDSDYDQLLTKFNKPTLEVKRLRLLAIEIFKTLNNLNPPYMKDIFRLNTRRTETGNDRLVVPAQNSRRYGSYTLRSLGPKIWNKLPSDLKNSVSLESFKSLIKSWSGPKCHCGSCTYLGTLC